MGSHSASMEFSIRCAQPGGTGTGTCTCTCTYACRIDVIISAIVPARGAVAIRSARYLPTACMACSTSCRGLSRGKVRCRPQRIVGKARLLNHLILDPASIHYLFSCPVSPHPCVFVASLCYFTPFISVLRSLRG